MQTNITQIQTFGTVAAEDDALQHYFLSTDAYLKIAQGEPLIVLGRKGSGKTALIKTLSEQPPEKTISRAVELSRYPWNVHATRIDQGAGSADSYTASWEYLLAVEIAALVYNKTRQIPADENSKKIAKFLNDNYGTTDTTPEQILAPDSLRLEGSLEPEILGNKLGSIHFKRESGDHRLGRELAAISESLLRATAQLATTHLADHTILLHFDGLDKSMDQFTRDRAQMLTGLVMAAIGVRRKLRGLSCNATPVIYLRTDIWDALKFSDKNKIGETFCMRLEWREQDLKKLIEARASYALGKDVLWSDLEDGDVMRGNQNKMDHLIARTYKRPRDVIRFCNAILEEAKKLGHSQFTNPDVISARELYSAYIRGELEDEIAPHWTEWEDSIRVIARMGYLKFQVAEFEKRYGKTPAARSVPADEALRRLFDYSVIGLRLRSGYGGSPWVFQYERPDTRWEPSALECKVHIGLKEYYRLKE